MDLIESGVEGSGERGAAGWAGRSVARLAGARAGADAMDLAEADDHLLPGRSARPAPTADTVPRMARGSESSPGLRVRRVDAWRRGFEHGGVCLACVVIAESPSSSVLPTGRDPGGVGAAVREIAG